MLKILKPGATPEETLEKMRAYVRQDGIDVSGELAALLIASFSPDRSTVRRFVTVALDSLSELGQMRSALGLKSTEFRGGPGAGPDVHESAQAQPRTCCPAHQIEDLEKALAASKGAARS